MYCFFKLKSLWKLKMNELYNRTDRNIVYLIFVLNCLFYKIEINFMRYC